MAERIFMATDRHGANLEFEIRSPTRAIESECEMLYRIAYTEALKQGVPPREKIRKILKDHQMWTEEDEVELRSTVVEIARSELALKNKEAAGDRAGCIVAAGNLAKQRRRLWELLLIQQSPFTNSCEAYAELVRKEAELAASVAVKATGTRYWSSYKDYVIERDTHATATVAEKAMEVVNLEMAEEQTKIMQNQPEQQWLQRAKLAAEEDVEKLAQDVLIQRAKDSVADGVTEQVVDQVHTSGSGNSPPDE
jgi:hypothetical protein